MVLDIKNTSLLDGGLLFVDPAMADNGKLYPAFDDEYVKAMVRLCAEADYILPNITEACFLTGIEYKTEYDRAYVDSLMSALSALGAKNVILTGVSFKPGMTGIMVLENGEYSYYEHEFLKNSCHGTGDIYASAFVGAMMRGHNAYESAKIAADYTVDAIRATAGDSSHWYGAKFEPVIGNYIEYLK
jgi:pyridoxine kinase